MVYTREMSSLWYLLIFFLGAAVGSFLNVLVNRTVEGGNWVNSRSKCDHCKKTLKWYDMIPVLSYLWYRGRARCCKKNLSYQHPLVESLVGLLFVWWALLSTAVFELVSAPGATVQPLFWLLTGIVLMAILVADLFYGVIPLPFVVLGTLMVIVYRVILVASGEYQLVDLGKAVAAGLVAAGFYLFLHVATRGKGMGEGDIWLALYLGILVGYPRMLPATLLAFVVGAVVASLLMLAKVKTLKQTVPFGPFMIVGAGASLLWGDTLIHLLGF